MSRSYCSYDEEWQRRKSVLIRSLFHDIPILSPVEEESNDSSQDYNVPTQEVFPSPPRPYSPLPPLIIERVPVINKHDEPEEYYRNLHKKIKRFYLKLFIEKRNISSVDNESNYSDASAYDDNLSTSDGSHSVENLDFRFLESISSDKINFDSIIEDREATQSYASTKSNGYGADFESMDTAIVDVINYTMSNEDALMISEEEESNSENLHKNQIRNEGFSVTTSLESKTSSREKTDDRGTSEEQNSRHSTIYDQEMTESGDSNKTEVEQSYEEEESNTENIDEHEIVEISQTGEADRVRIDDPEIRKEESHHSKTINEQEKSDSLESSEPGNEQQSVNVTKTDSDSPMPRRGENRTAAEDRNELIELNVEPMEGDAGSSEGPDYRQITIEALVHFDGTQDTEDRESRVYEDSVKSVILPTRFRRVVSHKIDDRIEVLAILEEKDDPKNAPIFDTDEDGTTDENLEEETTPQLDDTEKGDEKMKTSQDAIDEDIGALKTSSPETTEHEIDTPEEEVKENRHLQPVLTEKDLEAMQTYQLDATSNAEIQTRQQNAFEKKIEAMRTLQQTFIEKYLEEIKTHQSVATEKEIRAPQLATIEKDFERTQITTPETITRNYTEIRTQQKATNVEIRTRQSESNVEEDGEETDEEMGTPDPLEIMRTPRPDLSHGTLLETHESNSGSTSEHIAVPQEATAMTSSFQDGVDNNISELQTSNDMNEILTSIFNESQSKAPVSGRKRKLVDKSVQAVQTSRVTWEEMRSNFFVATPKIFRLCACTDHICY